MSDLTLHARPAPSRSLFLVFLDPSSALGGGRTVPWPLALAISGTAFLLLFLQTGLDLMRAGAAGQERVATLAGLGLIYGTAGIALIAVLAWCVAAVAGAPRPLLWTMTAFALAFTPALLYGVCGISANLLLRWNTASTFGVTGVLWALGPLIAVTRDLLPGRTTAGLILATLVGGLALLGWAVLSMGG